MTGAPNPWREYPGGEIPAALDLFPSFYRRFGPEDRLLDVGCGPGRTMKQLAARGYRRLTGVDINFGGVDFASRSMTARVGSAWVAGDCTRLPFASGAFHGAIMQALLTTLPAEEDRRRAVFEAARVLRPGGGLYVAAFGQTWDNPVYRRRYEDGAARGLPAGTFEAPDGRGGTAYLARHFTREEVAELLVEAGLRLDDYSAETFTTRTGKQTAGHVFIAGKY